MILSNRLLWALVDHKKNSRGYPQYIADSFLIANLKIIEAREVFEHDTVYRCVPVSVKIDKTTGEIL